MGLQGTESGAPVGVSQLQDPNIPRTIWKVSGKILWNQCGRVDWSGSPWVVEGKEAQEPAPATAVEVAEIATIHGLLDPQLVGELCS